MLVDKPGFVPFKTHLSHVDKKQREAYQQQIDSQILHTQNSGYLEPDVNEKSWKITQQQIRPHLDLQSFDKYLSLDLQGPSRFDFTSNGRFLLLSNQKGHVSTLDWQQSQLLTEQEVFVGDRNPKEKVNDVQWLHNEMYFALAQEDYCFIHDHTGAEFHRLNQHQGVRRLEFLKYHFLLASIGRTGWLKYTDVSTGQFISQQQTKLGNCEAMSQNPRNAIIHLGHSNGTVTLWSPNTQQPLVKILTHTSGVRDVAVDPTGNYMVTCASDSMVKIWDLRTYQLLNHLCLPQPATSLSISQKGILAIGHGPRVSLYTQFHQTQSALPELTAPSLPSRHSSLTTPYMTHLEPGSVVHQVKFCPYQDILGITHSNGFKTLFIPGSGEAQFDALEENPYSKKKFRQEQEVRLLLDKLKPDMITLDNDLGRVQTGNEKFVQQQESKVVIKEKVEVKEKSGRKRSTAERRLLKKQQNVVDARKEFLKEQKQKRAQKKKMMEEEPSLLKRFSKRK